MAMGAKMSYLDTRQGVLAQNIANADTPEYRPRDLTDVNKDTDIAGSNVRLYPKVINTNTASAGTRVNYLSSGDLFDVMEIGSVTDFGYNTSDSDEMADFGPLFFSNYLQCVMKPYQIKNFKK